MKKVLIILITAFLFAVNTSNPKCTTYAAQQSVSFSLPLKFKWGHGGLVRGQKYKVKLKALQKNTPMPENSQTEEYVKAVPEDTIKEVFPPIVYTNTGDYRYEIELIRGDHNVLKKYYLHIQVLNRGNDELSVTAAIHKNTQTGEKVTEIRFVDIGDDENLDEKKHDHYTHKNYSEREDEYLKDKYLKDKYSKETNKNSSRSEVKTNKNSVIKSKTGDDSKVEMYLWMSIISLGIILLIGCKKLKKS